MRLPLLAALLAIAVPNVAGATVFGEMSFKLKKKTGTGTSESDYKDFTQQELSDADYFNQVGCECADNRILGVEMILTGSPPSLSSSATVEIWVGTDCENTTNQADRCVHLTELDKDIEVYHNRRETLDIAVADIVDPLHKGCTASTTSRVWALIEEDSATAGYEHKWTFDVKVDAKEPAVPTEVEASGVEDGIDVSWEIPATGEAASLRGFQILCAKDDGTPLLTKPADDPEYTVHSQIAGCTAPVTTGVDAGVPDAGSAVDARLAKLPATFDSFKALDPSFICSDLATGTSESKRVDLSGDDVTALDPNATIHIMVVAIDNARNAAGVEVVSGGPQSVRDAWEVYHDANGSADGGFCFVATAVYGDYDHPYVRVLRQLRDETLASFGLGRDFIRWYYAHSPPWADFLRQHEGWRMAAAVALFPVVALAWAWNGVGLGGFLLTALLVMAWRRRRRLALALAGLTLFCAVPARAQVFLDDDPIEEDLVHRSRWAFELKLGPYHPDVDGESGLSGTPFDDTFGSGNSLFIGVELDFFIFNRIGELGLAGAIGHMSDSAKSFTENPATGMRSDVRSADETTFRLIPMSLSIVYRMTELADRTVIPLVPYGKIGLSYYLWQITTGDGDVSSIMDNDARGGTFGWQATGGIMVRAEGIDASAERNLQTELGVEHAGFFFELTYANVSGLFQSNRLHVGDLTWAAGVGFEF